MSLQVQADSTSVKSASRDGRSGYSKAEYVTLASIDGGWSEWSKFPPCDVCTSDTVTTRSRTCNNPEPHFGGKPCEGSSRQNMPCNLTLPCIGKIQWHAHFRLNLTLLSYTASINTLIHISAWFVSLSSLCVLSNAVQMFIKNIVCVYVCMHV